MKLIKLIKYFFKKRSSVEVEILKGIDIENLEVSPKAREEVKERIQEAVDNKEQSVLRLEIATARLTLLQKIGDIPQEELKELERIAKAYSQAEIERDSASDKVKNQNTIGNYLENYKDNIEAAVKNISEHEKKIAIIKNDLYHLEGERADILYRTSRANIALDFTKILLLITIILASITTLILSTMFFAYSIDVFVPALVVVVIVSMVALWIFAFRRYLVFEIKKNQKLINRAVELTNKVKIKYVNVQQFLDYEYKKYKINSSEMLELRWENYQKNKRNQARYKNISNNAATLKQELDRILIRNNIEEVEYITENIDYFSSEKAREKLFTTLKLERDLMKAKYAEYENEITILSKLMSF